MYKRTLAYNKTTARWRYGSPSGEQHPGNGRVRVVVYATERRVSNVIHGSLHRKLSSTGDVATRMLHRQGASVTVQQREIRFDASPYIYVYIYIYIYIYIHTHTHTNIHLYTSLRNCCSWQPCWCRSAPSISARQVMNGYRFALSD